MNKHNLTPFIHALTTGKIVVIIGPTGSGKSALSLDIARQANATIISADAFQIYRYMDIGTDKISIDIRKEIPHHLIDIKTPDMSYSVAEFLERAKTLISELQKNKTPIIICGGTAFYLYAFLHNYDFPEEKKSPTITRLLEQELFTHGKTHLWEKLQEIDHRSAQNIDPNNVRRVIRALEKHHTTKNRAIPEKAPLPSPRSDCVIAGITLERSVLYDRINQRVDRMVSQGLIEEVQALQKRGYQEQCQALQAIGYKEPLLYINGGITKEKMIDLIKVNTRRFAKRQLTWYRQFEMVRWLNAT